MGGRVSLDARTGNLLRDVEALSQGVPATAASRGKPTFGQGPDMRARLDLSHWGLVRRLMVLFLRGDPTAKGRTAFQRMLCYNNGRNSGGDDAARELGKCTFDRRGMRGGAEHFWIS